MSGKKEYNQFKAMFAISRASFRSITRSPSAVVFTLVFPLIFILVFGFIGNNGIRIDVAVSSKSDKNNAIYYAAHFVPAISLKEDMDDAKQLSELSKGKLDAIVTITPVRKDSLTNFIVDLQTSTASMEKGIIARSLFEHLIDKSNLNAAKITHPMAELREKRIKGRGYCGYFRNDESRL